MTRLLSLSAGALLAALSLAGCCPNGTCIKDPPCRPCEDPCRLTPVQKVALGKGTHALTGAPVVYTYGEKTYYLFSEAGLQEFEKDPGGFEEKGAIRVVKGGKTRRADMNPGDGFDWAAAEARARPYAPPPK
jgi:YHS domain-containing protein